MSSYFCKVHETFIFKGKCCSQCVSDWNNRKAADEMTPQERADEYQMYCDNVLTIPFGDLHTRIEELVGRPVWTHELARPEWLVKEILSGKQASFGDVVGKISKGKGIIVVAHDGVTAKEATPDAD